MEINIQDIATQCLNSVNDKIKNLKRLNIILIGKTGVGKSTLINYIFREQLVETGIGKPVTQHIKMISKKDFPLTIYDTKGLELGKSTQKEVKQEILSKLEECAKAMDKDKVIHCIWYCVNTASDRIEEDEIEWVNELSKETDVPIIIVLTKAFANKKAQEFKKYIDNLNMDVCAIIPVLALDYEIDDEYVIRAYGAEELIGIMGEFLGEELIPTLQNVQKSAIKQKVKYAQGIVAATVLASFGEGFAPVPFADAAMLIPTQLTMIASITVAFGLNIGKGTLVSFISGAIGTSGATLIGKTIVANLLKLIPGVGTTVGGMISGTTASVLTTALGETYIKLLERICLGELKVSDLEGKESKNIIKKLFKHELKEAGKK